MKLSKIESRALQSITISFFDYVATFTYIKNKWITIDAWLKLIKDTTSNTLINKVTSAMLKNYLIRSGKVIENSTFINQYGYYLMSKRLVSEEKTQRVCVSCILVTQPFTPIPGCDWTKHLITAISPPKKSS